MSKSGVNSRPINDKWRVAVELKKKIIDLCWYRPFNENFDLLLRIFSLTVTLFGSSWHVSGARVNTTYRAFSKEKIIANIGVHIGLNHVNITLQGKTLTT